MHRLGIEVMAFGPAAESAVRRLEDGVEHAARIHLLEKREAELVRRSVARSRRDGIMAGSAAAVGHAGPCMPAPTKPNLIVPPDPE